MSVLALLTAVGVAAGSWSVWSVVGVTAPSGNPAPPLWFSPPALEVTTTAETTTPPSTEGNPNRPPRHHEADDDHDGTGSAPTTTHRVTGKNGRG